MLNFSQEAVQYTSLSHRRLRVSFLKWSSLEEAEGESCKCGGRYEHWIGRRKRMLHLFSLSFGARQIRFEATCGS